jgi:ectoine hydroxylase-related dioxygenase (phytanoyl-CoA dioxygenase family)
MSGLHGRVECPTEGLVRPVTDEERAAYARDGAAILKGIIPIEWVDYMQDAVNRLLGRMGSDSQNYADEGKPRFFAQAFPWLVDEGFEAWALYSPLKDIAHQVMADAAGINFFYDQVFVKEPGADKATPWHQDIPYLPLAGEQVIRIWVPCDRVTKDGGAVQYLKGSHRWGVVYHPVGFKAIPAITDAYVSSPYADQPDFDADYDKYDWLVGEAEPGDALLHHPKTVHGSRGNVTGNFRRAVASVFTGDKVVWNPHPANMFLNKDLTGHVQAPDLSAGGPIDCPLFPRVWPASAEEVLSLGHGHEEAQRYLGSTAPGGDTR